MALLSDDSSVRSQVLPSIWRGYKTPRAQIMGEELPFKGMISAKGIPQEWIDEMVRTFQNGSLADFMEKYLGRTLTEKDHEKILLKADKILKVGLDDISESDDPLMAILAIDLAHNADEYGHHLFQTACFLKKHNQLPNEARFVLGQKINPALYSDEESFGKAEKALLEPTRKIPHKWAQSAFYEWTKTNDSVDCYLAHMKEMAAAEIVMATKGLMPVERAVHNYVREHHEPAYCHRPRPRGRQWRLREE